MAQRRLEPTHELLRVGRHEHDRQQRRDPDIGHHEIAPFTRRKYHAHAGKPGCQRADARADHVGDQNAIQAHHGTQDGDGGVGAGGAKEHPADHNHQESQADPHGPPGRGRARQVVAEARPQRLPGLVQHQIEAVQAAPYDEGPARTVPQAAQQHRRHQVDIAPGRPLLVATQRNVEIVAQEARQRHVPAAPEIGDVHRLVGRVEVQWQAHADHVGQADRHVRIAGEVEVELQGVSQGAAPRLEQAKQLALFSRCKHRPGIGRHAVGKHHLLEQPQREDGEPHGEEFRVDAVGGRLPELRHHLLVVQHRAGNQVREVGDEQAVMDEVELAGFAARCVHQEGNLCEGEEGDAQRQDDLAQAPGTAQRRIDGVNKEIGVFVVAQQGQVGCNPEGQQALAPGRADVAAAGQPVAHQVVEADRSQQQADVRRVPPAVEKQGAGRQP